MTIPVYVFRVFLLDRVLLDTHFTAGETAAKRPKLDGGVSSADVRRVVEGPHRGMGKCTLQTARGVYIGEAFTGNVVFLEKCTCAFPWCLWSKLDRQELEVVPGMSCRTRRHAPFAKLLTASLLDGTRFQGLMMTDHLSP